MTRTKIRPRKSRIPEIGVASDSQREIIYRLRHAVYARELGQHVVNATERIRDELDDFNVARGADRRKGRRNEREDSPGDSICGWGQKAGHYDGSVRVKDTPEPAIPKNRYGW